MRRLRLNVLFQLVHVFEDQENRCVVAVRSLLRTLQILRLNNPVNQRLFYRQERSELVRVARTRAHLLQAKEVGKPCRTSSTRRW